MASKDRTSRRVHNGRWLRADANLLNFVIHSNSGSLLVGSNPLLLSSPIVASPVVVMGKARLALGATCRFQYGIVFFIGVDKKNIR